MFATPSTASCTGTTASSAAGRSFAVSGRRRRDITSSRSRKSPPPMPTHPTSTTTRWRKSARRSSRCDRRTTATTGMPAASGCLRPRRGSGRAVQGGARDCAASRGSTSRIGTCSSRRARPRLLPATAERGSASPATEDGRGASDPRTQVGLPSLSGHASASSVRWCQPHLHDSGQRGRVEAAAVVYASVDNGAYWTFMSVMTPSVDDGGGQRSQLGLRFGAHRYFYRAASCSPTVASSRRSVASATDQRAVDGLQSDDGGRVAVPVACQLGRARRPLPDARQRDRLRVRLPLPRSACARVGGTTAARGGASGSYATMAAAGTSAIRGSPRLRRARSWPSLHEPARRSDPDERWRPPSRNHLHGVVATACRAPGADHLRSHHASQSGSLVDSLRDGISPSGGHRSAARAAR